ncbi:serine hydrolase [Rhodohalobacter sp.]|uniref:serine hydrolase domain-containing protein n=1 Tax=Rhodohalobacter sp. TaxID=1974210 RepID=UPI002ACDF7CF|nr:serine hydrolase [Rhodohalobacter sp.]MDZ7755685.1 serine hydrolase [Rhodohalobacter sp.]
MSCENEQETNSEYEFSPQIDEAIERGLSESSFTGAVVLVGSAEEIRYQKAYGYATLYDRDLKVVENPDNTTVEHLFDIASLTKIFATTYGMMALHSDGLIQLDDPVSDYIEEFAKPSHSEITIRHLLSHTSGLRQWYPTYYAIDNSSEFVNWVVDLDLSGSPGENRRYSDLGFMVLAEIIKRVTEQNVEEYLYERIYEPLGLKNIGFNPNSESEQKIVSTSHGNPFERKMISDDSFGYRIDVDPNAWDEWRDYTLNGEVNDGNAFYTFSGVTGHAGLFAPADELSTLLQLILKDGYWNDREIISSTTVEEFTTEDQFENGLGWAMDPGFLHAENLPEGSVGHTGFTGVNFVMSPKDDLYYIFLTNRQHVGVDKSGNYPDLRSIREELSSIIFKDL